MRITDFPILREIKDEYTEHRYAGSTREEAVAKLMDTYSNELEYGEDDDAYLFWIGLADAQYFHKELTEDVAEKAIQALNAPIMAEWEVAPGDINRRKANYEKAPMMEKKFGKPRPKFRCEWAIGDTYAYQMTSDEAKEYGICGKYILFRKVSEISFCDRVIPIVTLTLWDEEPLPSNEEELTKKPILKLCDGGRCSSPKDKFEYRAEILIKNKRQLASMALTFVGNFLNVPMPNDEIIFTNSAMVTMISPEMLEHDCCIAYKMHQYCTEVLTQEQMLRQRPKNQEM